VRQSDSSRHLGNGTNFRGPIEKNHQHGHWVKKLPPPRNHPPGVAPAAAHTILFFWRNAPLTHRDDSVPRGAHRQFAAPTMPRGGSWLPFFLFFSRRIYSPKNTTHPKKEHLDAAGRPTSAVRACRCFEPGAQLPDSAGKHILTEQTNIKFSKKYLNKYISISIILDQNETLLLRKKYGLFAQLKCEHTVQNVRPKGVPPFPPLHTPPGMLTHREDLERELRNAGVNIDAGIEALLCRIDKGEKRKKREDAAAMAAMAAASSSSSSSSKNPFPSTTPPATASAPRAGGPARTAGAASSSATPVESTGTKKPLKLVERVGNQRRKVRGNRRGGRGAASAAAASGSTPASSASSTGAAAGQQQAKEKQQAAAVARQNLADKIGAIDDWEGIDTDEMEEKLREVYGISASLRSN